MKSGIEEGNKTIARFLGIQYHDNGTVSGCPTFLQQVRMGVDKEEDIQFHNSWDNLMPVVWKINKMGKMITINMWSEIAGTECKIYNWETYGLPYQESLDEIPIKSVWQVVVAFIQFNSSQSKNQVL